MLGAAVPQAVRLYKSKPMQEPESEAQRRRAIAWAIALTADTPLAPQQYEQELLEAYAQGQLTLDQVLAKLESQVHHVLYHSEATQPFTRTQLTELLEQARHWNEEHHVTGLLCYSSSGHFVQLLEGPAATVHRLFAKIQQDPRHHHVVALSDRAGPTRWFTDWRMAFAQVTPPDFYWLVGRLNAQKEYVAESEIPISHPRLLTLLAAFSKV
ncbi:MAG: hypothetical protein EOO60_06950 [Hymenobacter sp.]|nr:MAG: hypothetical protein EOO60_06950 [Hymenobacter sp.]